ncbi:hypothetical protein VTI28DRAFT_1661 [Corynascus sepedonium]
MYSNLTRLKPAAAGRQTASIRRHQASKFCPFRFSCYHTTYGISPKIKRTVNEFNQTLMTGRYSHSRN